MVFPRIGPAAIPVEKQATEELKNKSSKKHK